MVLGQINSSLPHANANIACINEAMVITDLKTGF